MTITIDDESYIVGVWFSSSIDGKANVLTSLEKDKGKKDSYKVTTRFRDSKNEKKWYEISMDSVEKEQDAINAMDKLQQNLTHAFPEHDKIIVQGDIKKFFELCKEKPWMHIREVKNDE